MSDAHKQAGRNLRTHRRLMRLSQTDVAQKLHLKSSAIISRWERGKALPSLENALRLSVLYKTLVNELFWDLFVLYRNELHEDIPDHSSNDP